MDIWYLKQRGEGCWLPGGGMPQAMTEPVSVMQLSTTFKNQWNMQLCAKWLFDAELVVQDV